MGVARIIYNDRIFENRDSLYNIRKNVFVSGLYVIE